jgi:DNA modification methylase
LVWPGKYGPDGAPPAVPRVGRPLHLHEVHHAAGGGPGGWRNQLIWGDNLLAMGALLPRLAGQVDLVYIDPPYATGSEFSFATPVGDGDGAAPRFEGTAYRDCWRGGLASYLEMMYPRLVLIRELLHDEGSLFLHARHPVAHYLNALLDEVFGARRYQSQIIWHFTNKYGAGSAGFDVFHHVILHYSKSARFTFNPLRVPVKVPRKQPVRRWNKELARNEWLRDGDGNYLYRDSTDKELGDVWEIPVINPMAGERLGYATQKPEALLENIIRSASHPGGLVADFFCGSGTTLAVAEKLGRRWLGCDLGRFAIHTTRKRLHGLAGCRPFEVLTLGRGERQAWQATAFGQPGGAGGRRPVSGYRAFLLRLYGAQPLRGFTHLHGQKGEAVVHVGAVDRPVTGADIRGALGECRRLGQAELQILGWEWAEGVPEGAPAAARRRGVDLLLLQIPREVMEQPTANGEELPFFELACLEAAVQQRQEQTVRVVLQDFLIPHAGRLPEKVRAGVRKWSDYVDFWAVDWDYRDGPFAPGWAAYRTRRERSLALSSAEHRYERPGGYRVAVKVVDIFGNETVRVLTTSV